MKGLERLATVALFGSQTTPSPALQALDSQPPGHGEDLSVQALELLLTRHLDSTSTSATSSQTAQTDDVISSSDFYSLSRYSDEDQEKGITIIRREQLEFRDIIKYGLIKMGYAMEPSVYASAPYLAMRDWIARVVATVGNVSMRAALAAGFQVITSLKAPDTPPVSTQVEKQMSEIYLAGTDLYSTNITLGAISYLSAMMAIMSHLGIPPKDFFYEEAVSPFVTLPRQTSMGIEGTMDEAEEATRPDCRHVKPNLMPTAVQRTFIHHPCYDAFPWPAFRSKIIVAVSTDPPHIDKEELCLDLLHGGIRCWGSTTTSLHGRGDGVPWDARSWEVAPWLFEKWEMLTDGRNGEMWRNSSWWRSMRTGR